MQFCSFDKDEEDTIDFEKEFFGNIINLKEEDTIEPFIINNNSNNNIISKIKKYPYLNNILTTKKEKVFGNYFSNDLRMIIDNNINIKEDNGYLKNNSNNLKKKMKRI